MENKQNFVIENGVLTKYTGPSGDVTIPAGVTKIGGRTFSGCTGLTSVTIPAGVKKIEEQAFYGCTGLTSVTIPEGVTGIGSSAFYGCKGLTSVTIPAGVKKIEEQAFYGCTGLTSVTIPESITFLGQGSFSDTPWLKSLGDFAAVNGILLTYQGVDREVTIPAGVKKIGEQAFRGCTGLTSVTIPAGVKKIGEQAFRGCTGLTSVTIPAGVTKIGSGTFSGCTGLTSVTIPEGVTGIGGGAFRGCTGLTSVTIPEGVKEIGEGAFSDCTGLTSVTIPAGVTVIEYCVFSGCTGLTSVTIPEGVTKIGERAFSGCTGLTSVTIPESIKKIIKPIGYSGLALIALHISISNFSAADKPGACAGFAKLYLDGAALDEEIKAGYLKYIKGQKKRLYSLAIQHEELLRLMLIEKMLVRQDIDPLLEECDRQNNIAAKAAVLDYAGKSLKPVDPVKEMEREFAAVERSAKNVEEFQATGVMKVGEAKKLFRYKKFEDGRLKITGYKGTDTAVVIPRAIGKDQVTDIGMEAFRGCTGLTSVTILEGVTAICRNAFLDCTGLTSVTIPESVTVIGDGAFLDCTGLTSVTIPAGVTVIWWSTFNGCTGLTSVTIPEGVTEIGDGAFRDCTGLTSVTIPEGVTEIGRYAFFGCTGLTSVTIPEGVTIRGRAFKCCHKLADAQGMVAVRGILFDYTGPSGDVTIPEGVTVIGDEAFSGCKGLTSVTIPEGVTAIGDEAFYGCKGLTSVTIPEGVKNIDKSVFKNSRPAIIAPHIPVTGFDAADKPGACAGFAKLHLDGAAMDEEIKAGYLNYIKGQKKLYPAAVKHEELLQLMFAEKMIPREDIDLLLEECDGQKNAAAKAAVLDYAHQFDPADTSKTYKL